MPAGRCLPCAPVLPRKSVSLASGRRVGYNTVAVMPGTSAGRYRATARRDCAARTIGSMGWNDLIGRQLGPYTIIDELGRGGSSRVYRGRDGDTQRDVAIKVIPNDAEDRVGFVR